MADELAHPDQIRRYAETYLHERIAKSDKEDHRRAEVQARLRAIERDNARLIDLMLRDGADLVTMGIKSKALGREREHLEAELAVLPEASNVVIHPASIENFARKLMDARAKLHFTLHLLEDMGDLQRLIREIIHSITVSREEPGTITIKVESYLQPFLREPGAPDNSMGAVTLVAEEGLEPPTRGL